METVSERLREGLENARHQLQAEWKGLEKKVGKFEKQVGKKTKEVPAQLRGAWEDVVSRLRSSLNFATRRELETLSRRVAKLEKQLRS